MVSKEQDKNGEEDRSCANMDQEVGSGNLLEVARKIKDEYDSKITAASRTNDIIQGITTGYFPLNFIFDTLEYLFLK
jgi:hypothetical protein